MASRKGFSPEETLRLSVAGFLFLENERENRQDYGTHFFLFGLRNGTGKMADRWELPGGKVEEGETLVQALERECEEELQLRPTVVKVLDFADFIHKGNNFRVYGCLAKIPHEPRVNPEHQRFGWFTLAQALHLDLVDSDRDLLKKISQDPTALGDD